MLRKSLKYIVSISVAMLILAGAFSTPASADTESFTWNRDQTKITGKGGWFNNGVINSTFERWSGIDPESGYTETWTNWLPSSGTGMFDATDCVVVLNVNHKTNKLRLNSGRSTCQSGNDHPALSGEYSISGAPKNPENPKDDSTEIADPALRRERAAATAAAFGGALDKIKNNYYLSLGSSAPCSSQGCDDSKWNEMVYSCWNGARADAASSARLSRGEADTSKLTKEGFASCLAGKISVSSSSIQNAIKKVSVSDVNKASRLAENQLESEREDQRNSIEDLQDDDEIGCQIDGIGWILCPVFNFMAFAADQAYSFVANMLETPPIYTGSQSNDEADRTLYDSWAAMRNIANVLLVIVFLIIIYSQLTSTGIDNYGIKRMLPKLIIAAILMNLSFIICALAIDLSNIVGSQAKALFEAMTPAKLASDAGISAKSIFDGSNMFTSVLGSAIAIGAIGAAIYAFWGVLLATLVPALLAVLVALLLLIARQAIIIVLVVLAPLAFVAFVLPNTETLFKRWVNLFKSMLLMFPIIGGLFGLAKLASVIIMNSAPAIDGSIKTIALQAIGALVAFLPLAITPIMMKSAGGLFASIGGAIKGNALTKYAVGKAQDDMKMRGERVDARRRLGAMEGAKFLGSGRYRRQARRDAIQSGIKTESDRAVKSYVAEQVEQNAQFRNQIAGGVGGIGGHVASQDAQTRALASALSSQDRMEAEEVDAAKVVIRGAGLDASQRHQLAINGEVALTGPLNDTQVAEVQARGGTIKVDDNNNRVEVMVANKSMRAAAISEVAERGSYGQWQSVMINSGSEEFADHRSRIASHAASKISSNPALKRSALDAIEKGEITDNDKLQELVMEGVKGGDINGAAWVSMSGSAREALLKKIDVDLASNDTAKVENALQVRSILEDAARNALTSPTTRAAIGGDADLAKAYRYLNIDIDPPNPEISRLDINRDN